jgi:tRNA threonylcarbamoyl adenosine modification protein (Sua5/YciO/YrdC/YwlC family)
MLYPTDTVYAIGCDALNKGAVERVRQLKRMSNDKPLTLLCSSLSDIATYAYVSDTAYRLMRHLVPGPYTFLLPATKVVPKLVLNPKRKTAGIRVPDHPLCQKLLKTLGNPIISTSAKLDGEPIKVLPLDPRDIDEITKQVDLVVDDQSPYRSAVSTVIDLTADEPVVLRQGLGYEAVDYLPYQEDVVPV